ncbi:maker719 [Drosophila busckii]|uniref:Maker719 n=1 Tax=Drosophila busckii TaxID=30019 RepID=A0A0M4ELH3_DROBS|nr:maker719 [Drosophila busckii]
MHILHRTNDHQFEDQKFMMERLSGHGSLGLSSSSPAYTTHSGGHSGRGGPASGHSGHSGTHGSAATMHHQSLQSDFQPPYFPPPFHHSAQSPPQQQVSDAQ